MATVEGCVHAAGKWVQSLDRGRPRLDKGRSLCGCGRSVEVPALVGGYPGRARLEWGWGRKEEPFLRGGVIPEESEICLEGVGLTLQPKHLREAGPH